MVKGNKLTLLPVVGPIVVSYFREGRLIPRIDLKQARNEFAPH